jgi:hypothetical protein
MHNGAYTRLRTPSAIIPIRPPPTLHTISPDRTGHAGLRAQSAGGQYSTPSIRWCSAWSRDRRASTGDEQIADLIEFLKSLTDPRMLDTDSLTPTSVPSGLPLDVPGPRRFPLYQ